MSKKLLKLNEKVFRMEYYENLKNFLNKIRIFDKKGIPLINFYATNKVVYNPTTVILYALANLQLYLFEKNFMALNRFNLMIKWIISNGRYTKNGFILPLNFDHPFYKLKRGWISAMTQGLAVSCLVRQYILTKDIFFLKLAYETSRPLITDIKKGGCLWKEGEDLWLEEVPAFPPPHILNGFIYGLLGLYDLYVIQKTSILEAYISKLIITLKRNIYKYDTGYWSKYQLNPSILATLSYHKLHIKQLFLLYQLSDIKLFKKYAIKFTLYMSRSSNYLKARLNGNIIYFNALIKQMKMHCIQYLSSRLIYFIVSNKNLDIKIRDK